MSVINNVKALISTSKLTNLANAIRNKTGEVKSYTIDEMIEKINGMESSILTSLNVTTNGTYTPSSGFDGFDSVNVNVPTQTNNLVLINTIEVNGVNGIQTDIDMLWFDTYNYIMMIPDLTFSSNDWFYITSDGTTGGGYASLMPSVGNQQSIFLGMTGNKLWGTWFRDPQMRPQPYDPVSYLYWYLYNASNTMTGTIKIYGIKLT